MSYWTRKEKDDRIVPMDITKEWTAVREKTGVVLEKHEYEVNGITYKVDGKHIILHPTAQEMKVALMLSKKYGKMVELVPQIVYPQGIQTPDYLINGERFDLKSPTGKGKSVLYDAIAKKRKQSPNFIFDVTECPLTDSEIEKQITDIFRSRHTEFVEKIVTMRNDKIIKAYSK